MSLFSGLVTSKTRVLILMRLFLNPGRKAYLRELCDEFSLSPSQVAGELTKLSEAKLLTSSKQGRQILYQANTEHVLFPELQSMVKKALGMDRILDSIIARLGNLERAYLIGDYAEGKDTGLIDLMLVGAINRRNLDDLVRKTEKYIDRKIRTLVLTRSEYDEMQDVFSAKPILLLWEK
jgi:DNA-binding transcriptional ArsR family regulator